MPELWKLLMSVVDRPLVRATAALFSVVVVGGLLGFAWELGAREEGPSVDPLRASAADVSAPHPRRSSAAEAREAELVKQATYGLPSYKGVQARALAADYLGPDTPMAVAWFATKDTPDDVLGFYRKTLLDGGLPIVEHRYGPSAGYVGYMEPRSKRVHLISVLAQGDETLVFPSSGQVESFLEGGGQLLEELPQPEDAVDSLAMRFEQEGMTQQSVVATVPSKTVEQAVALYQKGFAEKGWRLGEASSPEPGQARLEVDREGEHATVLLRQASASSDVQIYITVTQRAPPGRTEEG